ncbi:MAG TPA: protein-glutamate O-methyltransferase CheR [Chitinophagaceae bacterium]|jgi:chemotaxis protein methyltransferase CheR|nr:protein-glutamate O-methyltransferase CheR [Chitinophagaceae bacterium]
MHLDDKEFKELLESIRFVYGYDFTDYSEASVKRRVDHFMNTRKITALDKLGKMILQDERLFEEFIQDVSVTVTEMFRDPAFFKILRQKVMKRLATYPFIKIWVAGCATGEEIYSIAILLQEEGLLSRSVIYATDINQRSLQIAKDAVYSVENMKAHTANYQKAGGTKSFSEYYKAKYNSVMFDRSLKQNIVFSPHNLALDRSFNEFQLIVCRNVLIYFNQQLQNKVINLFYESLCTFGFLGLGSKESLLFSEKKKCFEEVDRKEKIFMKSK